MFAIDRSWYNCYGN